MADMKCSFCGLGQRANTAIWSPSGVAVCLDCVVSHSGEPTLAEMFGSPERRVPVLKAWDLDSEWLRLRARERPRRADGWHTTHLLFGSEATFFCAQSSAGRRVVGISRAGWVPIRFNATAAELARISKARWTDLRKAVVAEARARLQAVGGEEWLTPERARFEQKAKRQFRRAGRSAKPPSDAECRKVRCLCCEVSALARDRGFSGPPRATICSLCIDVAQLLLGRAGKMPARPRRELVLL